MFKLINKKTKASLELDTDTLIQALIHSIEVLLEDINSLREDVEDLTDFVEDNLD